MSEELPIKGKYAKELKVKDALQLYFKKYHFVDGGYQDKWFRIKVGPVFLPFPNVKPRVDAVKIHDIHHVLTEYEALLKGEAEIGAWELGSGCGNYYVAWTLNAGSFFYGIFFFPKAVLGAFLRGRACSTSLYYGVNYDALLLNRSVGELRDYVGLDKIKKYTVKDYFCFVICCVSVLIPLFLFLAGVCLYLN
jgi:hypothetical protein